MVQVLIHSIMNAKKSWLLQLLHNPNAVIYVCGMPADENALIARAMGGVGWYTCPNGHMYTVGECTLPMEASLFSLSLSLFLVRFLSPGVVYV